MIRLQNHIPAISYKTVAQKKITTIPTMPWHIETYTNKEMGSAPYL